MNSRFARGRVFSTLALLAVVWLMTGPLLGATPSAEQALKLAPTQDGVDYDRPKPEDVARCKVSAGKIDAHVGWVVESPEGVTLRKFVDTNGDNVVDQWSYYKDGIEVYCDIDSKFTGKADQFRWFHTGGTRWGLDSAGDGKLDTWKVLSAEEATAEVLAALANRDAARFGRVLLGAEELPRLGLGKGKIDALAAKIAKAESEFNALAERQKALTAESKWLQFSGGKPGIVPAGTSDSTKDIEVYENVVAIADSGGRHVQVQIGTLVRVGSAWKAIDAPTIIAEGQTQTAGGGFFFQATAAVNTATAAAGAPSEETQRLLAELEKIEPGDIRRTEILQQLADQARTAEERATWYRQLADTINAAVQSGKSEDGDKRLQALLEKLEKKQADKNLIAYVKMHQLMAGYSLALHGAKSDPAKAQAAQTDWLKNLEQYVADYPTAPDAAEAMLQLGIAREYAGQEDDAKKWYGRILSDFPNSGQAKKAAGATVRIESAGKTISLSGKSPAGGKVDLADFRGKVVLIQYWASWCTPAKNDIPMLRQLVSKYGPSFAVLGVNLDASLKDLNAYLADNPLPWPQIFEEGGQDSRPANALGIITVPTMILVDQQGKVVSRNIQTADIETELKKLVR
jgi:thiol-disulfide isomerase/thioredoxin